MKKTATIDEFINSLPTVQFIKSEKKIIYANIEAGFDIETTSFFENEEPRAVMYAWVFGVGDVLYMGRTWEEFDELLYNLSVYWGLSEDKRVIVYVHNLGFEMGFLIRRYNWKKIFSIRANRPIYAITEYNIEFRCSYMLSGYSLAKLAQQIPGDIYKHVGDLNYKLYRHSKTPLTDTEKSYIYTDVEIILLYIRGQIKKYGNISHIPLTKTGVVRRYCKKKCLEDYNYYHKLITASQLSIEGYKQLKRAFSGGITHASSWIVGKVYDNVTSWDICSSYPTVAVSEKYPSGSPEMVDIRSDCDKEFDFYINQYCCVFDVEFVNFREKHLNAHILSGSKCIAPNAILDNGKIVECDNCVTTITNVDYKILNDFYEWDDCIISNFKAYRAEYLPKAFVKCVLDFYQKKTELKNVAGKEEEYLNIKEMLNAFYGMTVTDIARDEVEIEFDEDSYDWTTTECDIEKSINKYNNSKKRFLCYEWGVFITAYARYNITRAIISCGNDFLYCDTDSVKIKNSELHEKFFYEYNKEITEKLKKALKHHNLPGDLINPKTIDGKSKPMGIFEIDGTYDRFKTLGAKRYMYEKGGEMGLTVSGLNKKVVIPYLLKKYKTNDKVFNAFDEDLYIPRGKTGKNIHTYITFETRGIITDYLGNKSEYCELSSVNLTESDYTLSIAPTYREYLDIINESRI